VFFFFMGKKVVWFDPQLYLSPVTSNIVFKTQFLDPANEPRSALFQERP